MREPIRKGTFIVEYTGPLLTNKECDEIPDNRYLFEVNARWTVDGSPRSNVARYINHSCRGNADPVIREERRMKQQHTRGATAESMAAELRERDRRDRTRANSPLEPAKDSIVLDSTALSEDEVLQRVEALVAQKQQQS